MILLKWISEIIEGDVQEFALPGSGLTVTLCISAFSLDSILKTFIPPKSLVSKLGKYQAGLDVILQMATALGGLNTTAGVVIGAATQAFEFLKNQEKCHQDILNLFEHMGIILSIIADAGPLKEHSKMIEEVINSTLTCIKGAVEQVLIKCQDNMLKQLMFSSELADKISHFRSEFDDLKEQYKLFWLRLLLCSLSLLSIPEFLQKS
ncbi:hypothetical protein BDP27DRAFT_514342 [Rhodocollybia butyracea]|uniref:Uncharacterized protein n=1 Tax=Rhodocollybia butyracea TaxID=206335 RepID=A0A9P5PBL6_9AGAR|nr:hypothetical protein BDP27DRAFT_514342 [Rhodocollybia butyracea]